MKLGHLLIVFCFLHSVLSAQGTDDTSRAYVAFTVYPFAFDTRISRGSVAVGPSFLLSEKKVCLQVGLLYDFKKYVYYNHVTHLQIDTVEGLNLFFPFLFNYRYYTDDDFNCFFTTGVIFGGRYYVDENYSTKQASAINLIAGGGFSFNIKRAVNMRILPTIRYNGNVFPGVFMDLSLIRSKK